MVMEAPGSQDVGREFVRQYYTLLHEAPDQLHRFYSFNSSFVHGGVERPGEEQPPVTGQKDIHKKIMSLQFRNCHAKIRQVDSQSTVDNAIVIQVTGELSNDGEPMRRFMQTFVLASQSEKKFYVQNDIFRYQDEVFEDDLSDVEEDATGVQPEQFPTSNGDHTEEEPVQEPVAPTSVSTDSAAEEVPVIEPEEPQTVEPEPEPEQLEDEAPETEPVVEQQQQPVVTKPPAHLSWSDRVKGQSSAVVSPHTETVEKVVPEKPAPLPQRPRTRENRPTVSSGDSQKSAAPRPTAAGDSAEYPDNQQVFVGNIRHQFSEDDLIQHFSQWGEVVDLRINRKNRDAPHYGFVVFKTSDDVQRVLEDSNSRQMQGFRLNIERKIRDRASGPRPSRGGSSRGGFRGRGGASRGGRPAPSNHRGGANAFPARGSTPHQQRSN